MSDRYAGLQKYLHGQVDELERELRKLRKKHFSEFNRIHNAYKTARSSLSKSERAKGDQLHAEAKRLKRRFKKLDKKRREDSDLVESVVAVLEGLTDPGARARLHLLKISRLRRLKKILKKMIDIIGAAADIYSHLDGMIGGK